MNDLLSSYLLPLIVGNIAIFSTFYVIIRRKYLREKRKLMNEIEELRLINDSKNQKHKSS